MAETIHTKALKIGRKVESQREAALTYYRIIAAVYNLKLTHQELALIAHTALWGTISTPPAREEFIKLYHSSKASLNNIISRLQRKKLLYKDKHLKIRVTKELGLAFDKDQYVFNINMSIHDPA